MDGTRLASLSSGDEATQHTGVSLAITLCWFQINQCPCTFPEEPLEVAPLPEFSATWKPEAWGLEG